MKLINVKFNKQDMKRTCLHININTNAYSQHGVPYANTKNIYL
jgi:hypothetical protein